MCQLKLLIIFNFQVTSKKWREVSDLAKYNSNHWVSLDKRFSITSFGLLLQAGKFLRIDE